MHRYRVLSITLALVIGGALVAETSASASPKSGTHRYFFKSTGQSFTNASGAPLSQNAAPAAGDQFTGTDSLYAGTSAHHAKSATGSAVLNCVFTGAASATSAPARCEGVVALDGSLIYSISTQNFASSSGTMVFPITGGAGAYLGAKGSVKSKSVGKTNNSNAVISIH